MRPASTSRLLPLACLLLASLAAAQDVPGAASGSPNSKIDFAGAYGYIRPFISDINLISYQPILGGGVFSGSYYFKPRLGIQVEGIYSPAAYNDNNCVYTAQAGPILRTRRGRLVPYVHLHLAAPPRSAAPPTRPAPSGAGASPPAAASTTSSPSSTTTSPSASSRPTSTTPTSSTPSRPSTTSPSAASATSTTSHLSGGLVLRLTGSPRRQQQRATPPSTAPPNPRQPLPRRPRQHHLQPPQPARPTKTLRYLWEASAGHIAGNGPTAAVDTLGLAPGTYTVAGHLVRGPHDKPVAACTTSFTIRPLEPPTVTCSADRAAINSGDPVTVTAIGRSPQNLALTYSYTATNGVVTGDGPTAALSTIGSTPGTITVTCSVADTHGQTASATTSTVIAIPTPVAPKPSAQSLCGISFERDRKRPDRVDNEAKACLDDIALTLARTPEARLLIIGNHDTDEAKPQRRRARPEHRPVPHRREGHRPRPPRPAHRQHAPPAPSPPCSYPPAQPSTPPPAPASTADQSRAPASPTADPAPPLQRRLAPSTAAESSPPRTRSTTTTATEP